MPHSTSQIGLPASQTCLLQSLSPSEVGKPVETPKLPLPILKFPNEVLIRVHAVALNPTDYKMPLHHPTPGAVMGCDFVGTIVSLGDSVLSLREDLSLGARVCGAIHGSNPAGPNDGSFAQYLVADSRLVLVVPSAWSDSQAASLGGIGWGTLGLALFSSTGLALPHNPSNPVPAATAAAKKIPILVYGGATATGTMATQLLKLSGYTPITVNSPSSNDFASSYGSGASVSYTSADPLADLKTILSSAPGGFGTMKYAIDCISTDESAAFCHSSITRTGGRYAFLEYLPASSLPRKAVKSSLIMGYEMFGKGVVVNDDPEQRYTRPRDEKKLDDSVSWCRIMQGLLNEGEDRIKCHPPRVLEGKWEGIASGLDMLRKGQVKREKLVVRIDDE